MPGWNSREESLAIHEKARTIQQDLINRFPDKLSYQRSLAENINAIGYAYYRQFDYDTALRTFHEVVDSCQTIMKQQNHAPKPVWLLNLLALAQYNIGSIHKEMGDVEKALPALERALGYRVALAEQHPSVTEFQEKLGTSYREIAELQHKAHQDGKALQSIQKSVDVNENLVRSQPDQADFHSETGLSWNYLGVIRDDARRNVEAIACFERAIKEQEIAIDKTRDADLYKDYLCNHLDNLGEQYIDLGRLAEGCRTTSSALRISRELSEATSGTPLPCARAREEIGCPGKHPAPRGRPARGATVVRRSEIDRGSLPRAITRRRHAENLACRGA